MSTSPYQSSSGECWAEDSATVIFGDDLVEDFSSPVKSPVGPAGGVFGQQGSSFPAAVAAPPAFLAAPPAFPATPRAPSAPPLALQPPPDSLRPYVGSAPAMKRTQVSTMQPQIVSAPVSRSSLVRGMTWGIVLSSAAFFAGAAFYRGPSTEGNQGASPVVLDADALGPVPQPSLVELAARGESAALSEIKQKEPSSREPMEVVALFEGEEARARNKASQAILDIAKKSSFTHEDEAEFFRYVGDQRTFREALTAMATNESEAGPDLIYEAVRRFRLQNDVHDFAMALLMTPNVYQYASPALSVIIDAETTTSCDDVRKLLDHVHKDGDARSVRHMAKFAETTGCGKMGNEDCYPCLRHDRALVDALRAAQARAAPR